MARHERHAGTGEAEARADRQARAGHGHRHHHPNTTTAITTNTTPTTPITTTPVTTTHTSPAPAPSAGADGETDWKNTGTDWNTAANWTGVSGGSAPPSTSDVAWFKVVKSTNPNLSVSAQIVGLYFQSTASSGYDITSSSTSIKLTLTATGSSIGSETSNSTAVAIGAQNTSGTNTIDAPIILGASSSSTQTFIQASGGTLVINGVISSTNSPGLALNGNSTGIFVLNGANTFTTGSNGITMDGGTLKLGSSTALGATANAIDVGSNATATLDLNGQSIANAVSITGSGIGGNGALINSSATTATLSGTLDGSSTPTIGGTGNILISGQVIASGSSHLTKVGSNTVTFSNTSNNYSRPLDINVGTLQFAKTNAMSTSATTVASGATLAVNVGGSGEWTNGTSGGGTLGGLIAGTGGQGTTNQVSWTSGSVLGIDTTNASGGTFTYGGVIGSFRTGGNSVGLTKLGSNSLTLTGANTYTGATTVKAGSLFVNGSTASGSAVTVNNSGTTLGGSGTISGSVTVNSGANLAPGATGVGSTAIFHTGALTLSSGANLKVDLNNTTPGTGYDQIISPGAISINGSNLLLTVGSLTVGQKFYIVEDSSSSANVYGTFANATAGGTVITAQNIADTFLINYADNGDGGTIANDISLTCLTAVPEPSTWLAAALALGAVGYMQRRRLCKMLKH